MLYLKNDFSGNYNYIHLAICIEVIFCNGFNYLWEKYILLHCVPLSSNKLDKYI